MALDTYAALRESILSWLARPGDPLVSPAVPDMIQLFEREATRRLKVGGAEKRASLTALSAAVALPADFGELRLATSGGVVLSYVTPMQLPDGGGPPAHYTIIGNEMRLGPSPSGGCTVEIVYQSGVPPLSDTNISNWLLAQHPDCYLFGSLVEAESFIGSDERIPLWAQRREAAFASIETADRKARWGGAPLSIRAEGVSGGNGTAAGDWTSAPPVPIPLAAIVAGDGLTGGGTEGIVTLALDTPVAVLRGGTGAGGFAADAILIGSGASAVRGSPATVNSVGDLVAASYVATAAGLGGGYWWYGPPGENWVWYATDGVARLGRDATGPITDVISIDYATGAITAAGDFMAASYIATAAGIAGGFWWYGPPGENWAWYGEAGIARLGRFDGAGTPVGDALTINYTTGVVSLPNGATAPTPAPGDNDTSLATTAFVQSALAAGGSGINQLTGDVTAGPGSGAQAASLATVNANVGTFQGLTLDAKGRVTAASNQSYLTANQTVTLSGDLTGSGTTSINAQIAANAVGTTEIANGAVTYAKQQNVTAARLLGNPTGGVAAASEISLGTNLSFAGTVLNATGGAGGLSGMTAGQIPIAATATTVTSSGNLSGAVTTSGSLATTLANNAVATVHITNANVTYAKIQNVAANRLLGNATGSAAAPAEIALPLAVANGGTNKASWTAGSVAFAASTTAFGEDNANLFWDAANARLGVGITAPTFRLQVSGVSGAGGVVQRNSGGPTGTDSTTVLLQFADFPNVTAVGAISRSGTNAVVYGTSSDMRLKENVSEAQIGLEELMRLKVRDYNFKSGDRQEHGLIAQEVNQIYPLAVSEGGDDPLQEPWMIDYGRLTPLIIKSMQQQQQEILALREEIAQLRAAR